MSTGATEEGSIVGRLKLDSSEWDAELDKAGAKADELGRRNPKIEVRSDVAEAIAKLDAVAKATDKVAAAQRRLDVAERQAANSASTAYIANERLAAIMDKRGRTDLQVAAATEAAARADRNAEAAEVRHLAAIEALSLAQKAAARSALEEAAAQDVNTVATDKAASANGANASRMGLIVAAVAALVPMIAPLAGYAVAASGALAGMGAAGVLAILGVKDAMTAGTAEGAQFSAGLQILKGDLSQLEATAASGVLAAFDTAVADINGQMPSLNGEIGNFASMLSTVGGSVLPGVLNSFRVLNPLFMDAGQHIEKIAAGFLSWTQDGGLQQFAAYAISALPQVESSLQALGSAAMHLLQSLIPLGTFGLVAIQDVSNVINALPVPVLGALATGALSAFAAFKLWATIAPMLATLTEKAAIASESITLLGASMKIATGPIGWVIAGVAALGGVIAGTIASSDAATASMATYTDALKQDNGILGDNVRAQLAKALADDGAIESAKKLGLSAALVTDATMGNVAAQKTVTAAIKAAGDAFDATQHSTGRYGAVVGQATDKQIAAKRAADDLKAKLKEQGDAITATVKAGIDYNAAMSLGGSVAQTMASDLGMTVTAYGRLVDAQNTATAAAKTWKTETDILNGVSQSLEQTTINLASDYQTMATTITGNIKSMGKAAATSLDINTASGLANHQLILKQIQDSQAQADNIDQTVAQQTGSKAKGDAAAAAFAASDKQRIVDSLANLGLNRKAVEDLVGSLDTLHSPPPVVVTVQTADAMARVAAVLAALSSVPASARTPVGVNLAPNASQPKWTTPGHAGGGTITGPGTGTSDSVPMYWGSNGEEVIRTAAASFNRPFLKAYNANPAQALQSVAASGGSSAQASDRPIMMDGSLFGILRTMANGEARIVLNTVHSQVASQLMGGRTS